MALRNLVIEGDPLLRKKSRPVDEISPRIIKLLDDMADTMYYENRGLGIAAPQVGVPIRVVIVDLDCISEDEPQYKGFLKTYINGHILETSDDLVNMEEGCLSIPGVHENVKRPSRVRIQYLDDQLEAHDEWVDGFVARVIQHEFDHLEGKMFVDHVSPLRKQLLRKKLTGMAKGKFSCHYKAKPNH